MIYNTLKLQLNELLAKETNFITNASNFSALIFNSLESLNWVGFYLMSNNDLLLGPFQGKPACTRISMGKGVCGTAAAHAKTIIVDDVHEFPGHIACDAASNSEIVIPIIINSKLYGVLDIDSPIKNRFDNNDKIHLEELLEILINNSNLEPVSNYYNYK